MRIKIIYNQLQFVLPVSQEFQGYDVPLSSLASQVIEPRIKKYLGISDSQPLRISQLLLGQFDLDFSDPVAGVLSDEDTLTVIDYSNWMGEQLKFVWPLPISLSLFFFFFLGFSDFS